MTENLGGGNGPAVEQGETEREDSRVAAVLDPIDGDLGEAKEKFSSNMLAGGSWEGGNVGWKRLLVSSRSARHSTETGGPQRVY